VAECPEVGTVSQGDIVEEALANLRQAEIYCDSFIQALLPTLGMAASSLRCSSPALPCSITERLPLEVTSLGSPIDHRGSCTKWRWPTNESKCCAIRFTCHGAVSRQPAS